MVFRDLLLAALTYPDVIPDRAVRSAVALAKRMRGDLTLLTVQVDIPALHNAFANALVHLDRLTAEEEARSIAAGLRTASLAGVAAAEAGVSLTVERTVARLYEENDAVCGAARTRDLCLVSLGSSVPADRSLAEAVLFGSGRPVVVYPEAVEIVPAAGFGRVAIAWDGGARAARAVADAMPILQQAAEVLVLVATEEKPQAATGIATDLVRHLAAHGVSAVMHEHPSAHQPIGRTLREFATAHRLELIVMGGFGHARTQEFVLGGATASMLEAPPCPVLMAH